ncbi:substrate-binding domain-containing protein [Streptomyces sp. WMMC500]|uniref:substrate-binding domain-containing protein n=1 Tax=Streptomyces sp. WMMC500 TaxID=3015154 RepID=UPI00248BC679|nr:substrate-binding domain-containing protein [Streptomyces sp. WMMC500]WBB63390.1 substrate-binding domain-containing protein [Streptomyces sp. WMMC500]
MRRILGIVLAVLLIGGVAAAVVSGRDKEDARTATTTVRGVIGSEKAEFFEDPEVVKALADRGFTVRAETAGSWSMRDLPLKEYDFAFPSSSAAADELSRWSKVRGGLVRPFYSPLVVVTHRSTAEVLADNGLATLTGPDRTTGTLRMAEYVRAAQRDTTWQQLKGTSGRQELSGTLFVSSTDPLSSNSGALYLAAASFVANGGTVVADPAGLDRTGGLLRKLVQVQGAQQASSDGPFRDFVSGVGNPLVLVYEQQVAGLLLAKNDPGDLTVLYPDTTVSSDHTVVPVTEEGRRIGELLRTDKRLRALAVRHGFRPQGAAAEFTAATAPYTAYLNQTLTGVRQAPVPTAEVLREMAARARG